jgi:phage tail-like protein
MPAQNPFSSYRYMLHVDMQPGLTKPLGGFQSASGLTPAMHKVSDVTLKRGVVDSFSLWNWLTQVRTGSAPRHNGVVTLRDEANNPVQSWKLTGAKPVKYTGPPLGGQSHDVAMEELVLSAESITIVPPHK